MSEQFEIDDVQPPEGARPVGSGFLPVFPEGSGVDGDGNPVGAIGKVRIVIFFDILTEAAFNWWAAQVAGVEYVAFTKVQWYNPYKSGGAGWEEWTGGGLLHRPTFGDIDHGNYRSVEIILTNLMPA